MLDAAETVFAAVGYEAATTSLIAAEAHCSIGSVYGLLGPKQHVARGLADRYLAGLLRLYAEVMGDDVDVERTLASVIEALNGFSSRHPGLGPLLRAPPSSEHLEILAFGLGPSLTEHLDGLLAARASSVDPIRRHAVATMCAAVLRSMLAGATSKPDEQRAMMVAEQKLVVASYVAAALPRDRL